MHVTHRHIAHPGERERGGVHSQEWLCYQRRIVLLRARSLCGGAARDGVAHGLRVRTAISCIQASVNGAACTARNGCATKGDFGAAGPVVVRHRRGPETAPTFANSANGSTHRRKNIVHPGERERQAACHTDSGMAVLPKANRAAAGPVVEFGAARDGVARWRAGAGKNR